MTGGDWRKYHNISPFKMFDSVPVPRKAWELSGVRNCGPRAASATQERPRISGVPAACRAYCARKAAGTLPWCVLWLQILVNTLTGQARG